MIMLEGADYSHFSRFDYPPEEKPTYLKEQYGIEVGEGSNIGRIVSENFKLADSATTSGLQIADLLASGIRRLFRSGFKSEEKIALLIGGNMVQQMQGEHPIKLVSLDKTAVVSNHSAHLIHLMAFSGRPMLSE
jgi:hypothetical protein